MILQQIPLMTKFSVYDALRAKHLAAQSLQQECYLSTMDTPGVHPFVFDAFSALMVCAATLCTVGAGGPSGIDAHGWQGLNSDELCGVTALFATQQCTTFLLLHVQIIALDESPGV